MSENMEARTGADNTVVRKGREIFLKFRGNLYPSVEKERPTPKGRYIVYPDGAQSWSEIKETLELLKEEGNTPKLVKYKGLWNVEAGVKVSE